ncbi:MAG: hypothetical protein ACR2NP_13250 [Pirellulaceae bacterium]
MTTDSQNPQTTPLGAIDMIWRLLIVFFVSAALVVAVASLVWDRATGLAALVAAIICCLAAVAATCLSIYPRGDHFRLIRLYTASAARLALPVILLFVCKAIMPELFAQGMVYFVVLFYLVGLLTDLMLQLRRIKQIYPDSPGVLGQTANGDS